MNYNIFSWNVNGIRAAIRKGALQEMVAETQPDILCLQETKAREGQAEIDLPEYLELWNSAERAGYSGTAVFTKPEPLSEFSNFTEDLQISYPWAEDQHGSPLTEGRLQTIEYPEFYLVNVYTPNSKRELSRLRLREQLWDPAFLRHLQALEQHKPVVACGDFNAAHKEIDLARPADNYGNAGFTKEERQGITNLLNAGLVDTFRQLHPTEQRYTWWTWRAQARARGVGWRIDYFFISQALLPHLKAAQIYEDLMGSDHCPISIQLEF